MGTDSSAWCLFWSAVTLCAIIIGTVVLAMEKIMHSPFRYLFVFGLALLGGFVFMFEFGRSDLATIYASICYFGILLLIGNK